MATVMAMSAALLDDAKGIDRPELRGTHLFDLTDRVAVVTGAGRGLGQAMAMALAAAGADVVVSSRTTTEIDEVRDEIRDLGRRADARHVWWAGGSGHQEAWPVLVRPGGPLAPTSCLESGVSNT